MEVLGEGSVGHSAVGEADEGVAFDDGIAAAKGDGARTLVGVGTHALGSIFTPNVFVWSVYRLNTGAGMPNTGKSR